MANLRNITELPVLETTNSINLIVNNNGSAAQVPAEMIGGAQSNWNTSDSADPSFIINKPTLAPLVLYCESDYTEDTEAGDLALNSILNGRQILIRVPNADGGTFTAIYSPVLMYQLPNYQNQYLYLFFLRDEKQDLSSIAEGLLLPTYGELKLKLSQEYNNSPLEAE